MTHTIGPNKFVSTVIACLIAAASTGTPRPQLTPSKQVPRPLPPLAKSQSIKP